VEVGTDGQVTVNGTTFVVSEREACEVEIGEGNRRRRVFVAGPPEAREVFVDGRVYRFDVAAAGARRKRTGSSDGDGVTAPMPGTVVKVLVGTGQRVRRGDTLIKLEAMKMELPMRAPHDATVKAVHCREGELVQAGVRLLDLE
jgi:biotin carboxyl carrier protein